MSLITLSNSDFEVVINPSLGGSIVAYNWLSHPNGLVPILRDAKTATSVLDASNFPLVPFSNRVKKGAFDWQGQKYNIPLNFHPETSAIHGQGWQNSWLVVESTETFLHISFEMTTNEWPFAYIAEQRFTLHNDGLHHELSITNTDKKTMPSGLGFHPYFVRTPKAKMYADVDKMWAVDDKCLPTELVNVPVGINQEGVLVNEQVLDNGFTQFAQKADIVLPELATKVALTASENCKFAVIFTPKDENFFCIEPVSHCTDAINLHAQGIQDTGVEELGANETFSIWMKLTPSLI